MPRTGRQRQKPERPYILRVVGEPGRAAVLAAYMVALGYDEVEIARAVRDMERRVAEDEARKSCAAQV